jgi:hypothetical protein
MEALSPTNNNSLYYLIFKLLKKLTKSYFINVCNVAFLLFIILSCSFDNHTYLNQIDLKKYLFIIIGFVFFYK